MLLWWKNQFSFLLTRLLFFGFLKQVLFILTMIICFESVSIIKYIHVIILFQLSGNNRNSLRVTVMSFHQKLLTCTKSWFIQLQSNKFQGCFKDKLQFSFTLWSHFPFLLLQCYYFLWQYDWVCNLKLHLRYRKRIWNRETD